jgi:hypothetical protein
VVVRLVPLVVGTRNEVVMLRPIITLVHLTNKEHLRLGYGLGVGLRERE